MLMLKPFGTSYGCHYTWMSMKRLPTPHLFNSFCRDMAASYKEHVPRSTKVSLKGTELG